MGSCLSSSSGDKKNDDSRLPISKKTYSWDQRERIDPTRYTVADVDGVTSGRMPGEVGGEQFIIRNCKDASIFILDNSASVTIDDCVKCTIILGPVKGSVFVRDCCECKLLVACQQFRTRDCKKIYAFLSCQSQPIIEASTGMHFGCYQCYYSQLQSQFDSAQLNVFDNNWDNVHDFTPLVEETNWSLIRAPVKLDQYLSLPSELPYSSVQLSYSSDVSVVPLTSGERPDKRLDQERCLLVIDTLVDRDRVRDLIQKLSLQGLMLVRMKVLRLDCDTDRTLFVTPDAATWQQIIALDVCGIYAATVVQRQLGDDVGVKYVSCDSNQGKRDVETIFNLSNFNMT